MNYVARAAGGRERGAVRGFARVGSAADGLAEGRGRTGKAGGCGYGVRGRVATEGASGCADLEEVCGAWGQGR